MAKNKNRNKQDSQERPSERAMRVTEGGTKRSKTIPAFYTDKDKKVLNKLGYTDFPTTKEGKTAHLEYRILNYHKKIADCLAKVAELAKEPSTLDKLKARVAALNKQIEDKEAELASDK